MECRPYGLHGKPRKTEPLVQTLPHSRPSLPGSVGFMHFHRPTCTFPRFPDGALIASHLSAFHTFLCSAVHSFQGCGILLYIPSRGVVFSRFFNPSLGLGCFGWLWVALGGFGLACFRWNRSKTASLWGARRFLRLSFSLGNGCLKTFPHCKHTCSCFRWE